MEITPSIYWKRDKKMQLICKMGLTSALKEMNMLQMLMHCTWNAIDEENVPCGPHCYLQQIPIWCRWYYWANPLNWTVYVLVIIQIVNLLELIRESIQSCYFGSMPSRI